MGRRRERRRPTKREKIEKRIEERGMMNAGRGRIGFEDLSPMAQGVVAEIARRQRCTREEIVEVLNQ